MTSFNLNRRLAATGAAGVVALGALASGGLVSPADASTAPPTKYVCKSAPQFALSVPVSVVGTAKLPARIKSARSMAGIPVKMNVTLPDVLIHQIASTLQFTKLSGNVKKAALTVGKSNKLPLGTLSIPTTAVPPAGQNMKLVAKGRTAKIAHAPKATGKYNVRMPKSFVFNPKSDAAIQTGPLSCTLVGKAGSFGILRVVRR